ncbi:hypothetical protein GMMP15_1370024 [Candidatus Magnetomoraceae bacterium gMMP-15]
MKDAKFCFEFHVLLASVNGNVSDAKISMHKLEGN